MSENSEKLEELIEKIDELSEQVDNLETQLCNIPILELDDIEDLMEKVLRKNKTWKGQKDKFPLAVRTI
jgi:prefoldin subunit 5